MYLKLRKRIRNIILDILSINSKPANGVHILNGHFLSLNDYASNVIFRKQLENLSKQGVTFIDIDKAVKMISEKQIDQSRCYVAFTFDDGFEECYTKIRPILNELNIKAAFFINPNFINGNEKYIDNFKYNVVFTNKNPMIWEQIINLKEEGHIIGSHTMDHLNLDVNDNTVLEFQIKESKKYLENKLNYNCDYFAFPYGQFKHISKLGIEIANENYKYVFSQSNYKHYFSCNEKVINRRHFECDWPYKHVLYFIKKKSL